MVKRILLVLVTILILISIPVGLYLVRQRQELRKRAAAATVLSISPASSTQALGSTFNINVEINSHENQVLGADLFLSFDNQILEALDITPGGFFSEPQDLGKQIDNNNGVVKYSLYEKIGSWQQGSGTLAVISFRAKAEGTSPITFEPLTSVAAEGELEGLAQANDGTVTVTSGPEPTPIPGCVMELDVPSPTPSPTPTGTVIPTPTPTATPTATPTPTPTGTIPPSPSPTPTPTSTATPTSTPTATPTATPTTPPCECQCSTITLFDESWQPLDPNTVIGGQTVYFGVKGTTSGSCPLGITKARFRINGGDWQETTSKDPSGEYYVYQYTIPGPGHYKIEAMVYCADLGEWR